MKNFSTAALCLAFASIVSPASVLAQTPSQQVSGNARCAFRADAPDQHAVARGDTLWDISGKFLQHPWCWPQVWDMNREQIHNPHWIYPGQIVYFDRVAGRLRLGKGLSADGGDVPTVRLSPQVRSSAADSGAIPTIPLSAIEQFLAKPLIVDINGLKDAPRIVAMQEGHVYAGSGEKVYVRGDLKGRATFQVFHPGTPLVDPATKKVLGYEAVYLGTLTLQRLSKVENEPSTFVVDQSKEGMGVGDRLVPLEPTPFMNYVPHAPEQQVDAQIMSIYGGVTNAGQNQIVSINRGAKNGIDIGTVLELRRLGATTIDTTAADKSKAVIKLPDELYGHLLVFRVFDNISYGLIMQVTDSLQVGDVARSPE